MSRVGAFIFPDRKKNIRQKEVKYHLNCRAVVRGGERGQMELWSDPLPGIFGSREEAEREIDS